MLVEFEIKVVDGGGGGPTQREAASQLVQQAPLAPAPTGAPPSPAQG
jgi:hypothetical protein